MTLKNNPSLLELNAVIFLKRLSKKYNKQLTLATIPDKEWKAMAKQGFDMVWLMGIWRRSSAARQAALNDPILRKEFNEVLPQLKDEDISASPYAIKEYSLDHSLGEDGDLTLLKEKINKAGMKLILDFVPNHLALDHSWTFSHPDRFINGTKDDCKNFPGTFFKVKGRPQYLAHGKDPYFPSWEDTVQVNCFSSAAREAMMKELLNIAKVCDGVRCDMAMLLLNQVFQETWFSFLRGINAPKKEFWEEAITRIRKKHSDFVFIAEAYWDLEWLLQKFGFDYTYDKKLYDRLLNAQAPDIKGHLSADMSFQEKSVRFIENHDEKRAAWVFGKQKSLAAAVITSTLPGLRFFYDGQALGKIVRLPVQLVREPEENEDVVISGCYRKLMDFLKCKALHDGRWELREIDTSWQNNNTYNNLVAYSWEHADRCCLIVVNYSPERSQGRIAIPEKFLRTPHLIFQDTLNDKEYTRDEKELRELGLFVDLEPWKAHLFKIS